MQQTSVIAVPSGKKEEEENAKTREVEDRAAQLQSTGIGAADQLAEEQTPQKGEVIVDRFSLVSEKVDEGVSVDFRIRLKVILPERRK